MAKYPSIPNCSPGECCALDISLGPAYEMSVCTCRVLRPSAATAGVGREMPPAHGHLQGRSWKGQCSSAFPSLTAPSRGATLTTHLSHYLPCSKGASWSERGRSECPAWRRQQQNCKKAPRLTGHQDLSTSTCNFSGHPDREARDGE